MRRRILSFWGIFALSLALILGGMLAYVQVAPTHDAYAGAAIVGNPDGAEYRALIAPQGGKVERIVYVATGAKTMADTTPVVGNTVCGIGAYTLYRADVILTGTMAGTNPTLTILWQNSIDGGTNWVSVGTWTTINATVTPASQSQVVSDVYNATTAVAFGDCWRTTHTFGGTGTVVANFSINGYAK